MRKFFVLWLLLLLFTANNPARAEQTGNSFGLRGGFGLDPDQAVIGVQTLLGEIGIARFAPSVDFSFGDDVLVFAFNFDALILDLSPPKSSASFYVGAGPTLAYWDPDKGDSDLEIGISILGGIRLPMGLTNRYNLEFRAGISDIPEIRILFGTLFGGYERG